MNLGVYIHGSSQCNDAFHHPPPPHFLTVHGQPTWQFYYILPVLLLHHLDLDLQKLLKDLHE
jgi:hypothetical protein